MSQLRFAKSERVPILAHPSLGHAWLCDRIVEDPSVLGLGGLRLADEPRLDGSRLELLLRDPASGRRVIALVAAGAGDGSDIVRCLQRWALEGARYPDHEHSALLVAEEFPPSVLGTVVALGAAAIPLLAMRAGAWRVGEQVVLSFTAVSDSVPPPPPPTDDGSAGLAGDAASVPWTGRTTAAKSPPRPLRADSAMPEATPASAFAAPEIHEEPAPEPPASNAACGVAVASGATAADEATYTRWCQRRVVAPPLLRPAVAGQLKR